MKAHTATRVERNTSPRVNQRLREWTVERVIETEAPLTILAGVACPPLALLRRLGFRHAGEIERERHALMALRGDLGQP